MRGKNKRRPNGKGPRDDQAAEEKVVTDENSMSATLANNQEWVMMPSRSFYNQFSLLGFGDDLQQYMKALIYQGEALEPDTKCCSEQ